MDQEISCSVLFCSVYNYSIFREKKGKQCFVHLKTDTIKSVELRRWVNLNSLDNESNDDHIILCRFCRPF